METKHTQGTWHSHDGQIYPEQTGQTICLIPYYDKDNEEQQANAKLIAAAPNMLESLSKLRREAEYLLNELSTNKYLTEAEQLVFCKNFSGATSELATDAINKATN